MSIVPVPRAPSVACLLTNRQSPRSWTGSEGWSARSLISMFGVGMKRSATRLPTSAGEVPAGQSVKYLFCAKPVHAKSASAIAPNHRVPGFICLRSR